MPITDLHYARFLTNKYNSASAERQIDGTVVITFSSDGDKVASMIHLANWGQKDEQLLASATTPITADPAVLGRIAESHGIVAQFAVGLGGPVFSPLPSVSTNDAHPLTP